MKQEFINYSKLFNKIKNTKELNAEEKLILSEIISVTLDGKPYQFTNPQIANWLGLSEHTVAKRLKNLRKKGIITSNAKNVPPKNGQGRFYKQRTITILELEKWVDKKGNNQSDTKIKIPPFFLELTPQQQESIKSIVATGLEQAGEVVSQEAIFEFIGVLGKDEVIKILKS